MSTQQTLSLETLPIEIIYHLCDFLDPKTILTSFRHTCRRLKIIIQTYNNYKLDFQDTSRSDFRRICHLINPGQVKSLTLSEKNKHYDQIWLFNSYFGVKTLTHLRCLSLIGIKESRLRDILKHINVSSLLSFSLEIDEHKRYHDNVTGTYLNSIFARSKLHKVILNIYRDRINDIDWTYASTLDYLNIDTGIDFSQISKILRSIPHLKTFITNCRSSRENFREIKFDVCQQLTRLSLKYINIKVDDLERFLQSMPALIYLKVIGNGNFCDGSRWEQFIQKHLPLLEKFEFVFSEDRSYQVNPQDIELVIASFQTSFWLQVKKCFVCCEYNFKSPRQILLYSIPLCWLSPNSSTDQIIISVSTLSTIVNKKAHIVVNNDKILFNFSKLTSSDIQQEETSENQPSFSTVKNVLVIFGSNHLVGWKQFMSLFINLTTITSIILEGVSILKPDLDTLSDIKYLLQETPNILSVILCRKLSTHKSLLTANDICWIIPAHIRYLTVPIKDLIEAVAVLERIEHLLTINFLFDDVPCWDQFYAWIETKKERFSYKIESKSLCVWRSKTRNSSNELEMSNKRIKLCDDRHD